MLKNDKGYFLAETIIALTIIATVITIIYVNSMSYYVKQNTELTKYNTMQGLYAIKEIKKYFIEDEQEFKSNLLINESGYIDVIEEKNISNNQFIEALDIKKIYFINYDMNSFINSSNIGPSIKKQLKLVNSESNSCNYRYLVIFNDESYSTIGVDCNGN